MKGVIDFMKEQKNLPVRRHRKRRKHRVWLRALPHVVLITACLAIIISITGINRNTDYGNGLVSHTGKP